jgi:hypothetical protein
MGVLDALRTHHRNGYAALFGRLSSSQGGEPILAEAIGVDEPMPEPATGPQNGTVARNVYRLENPREQSDNRPASEISTQVRRTAKVVKGDDPKLVPKQSFWSKPPPPSGLWDTDDVQYLDKVRCHAWIRMTHIDPKNGRYEGRIKCHWALRTLNSKERTEPRIRVPGLRLPRLVCAIEESRIWRHFDGDSERTVAWQGTTVLSFSGFEMFEVNEFPFDRQVINLDLFEFVWRSDKDSDQYFEAMKVVSFTTETISMLPEWDTYPAILEPKNIKRPGSGPSYATRFTVMLRLERREKYYVTQIFMVTYLILAASLLPLALAPGETFVGDRLSPFKRTVDSSRLQVQRFERAADCTLHHVY